MDTIIITAKCPYFEIREEVSEKRCVRRLLELRDNFEHRRQRLKDRHSRLTVTTEVKGENK